MAAPLYHNRDHDSSAGWTTSLRKRRSSSGNLCIVSFRSFRTEALSQQPLSQGWDNWSDGEGSAGAPCLSSLSVRLSLLLSLCSLRASPAQRDLFMVTKRKTWLSPKLMLSVVRGKRPHKWLSSTFKRAPPTPPPGWWCSTIHTWG